MTTIREAIAGPVPDDDSMGRIELTARPGESALEEVELRRDIARLTGENRLLRAELALLEEELAALRLPK